MCRRTSARIELKNSTSTWHMSIYKFIIQHNDDNIFSGKMQNISYVYIIHPISRPYPSPYGTPVPYYTYPHCSNHAIPLSKNSHDYNYDPGTKSAIVVPVHDKNHFVDLNTWIPTYENHIRDYNELIPCLKTIFQTKQYTELTRRIAIQYFKEGDSWKQLITGNRRDKIEKVVSIMDKNLDGKHWCSGGKSSKSSQVRVFHGHPWPNSKSGMTGKQINEK